MPLPVEKKISELDAVAADAIGADSLVPLVVSGVNKKAQAVEAGEAFGRYLQTINASAVTMATEDESDTPQPYFRLLPGGGAIANHVVKDGGTGDVISSEMLFTTFYNATTPAATLWRSMGSGAVVVAAFDPYSIPGDAGSPARNFADGELVRQLIGTDERLFAADGALNAIDFSPTFLVPAPTGTGSDTGIWVEVSPDTGTTTAPLIDTSNADLYDALDEIGGSGSLRPGLYRVTDATGGPVYLIAVGPHRLWPEFAAQDSSGSGTLYPGTYDVATNLFTRTYNEARNRLVFVQHNDLTAVGFNNLDNALAELIGGEQESLVLNGGGGDGGGLTLLASASKDCNLQGNNNLILIPTGVALELSNSRIYNARFVGLGDLTAGTFMRGCYVQTDSFTAAGVLDSVEIDSGTTMLAGGPNTLTLRGSTIITAGQIADYITDGGTVIDERGGSSSGDVAGDTHAATSKTTPVDADELPLVDSAASWALKKLPWANLKATLKTYFDGLYSGRKLWSSATAVTCDTTSPFNTTSEVEADFVTLSANEFIAGDWMEGLVLATRPGSQAGNITVRVRMGTSGTATSNQLIATYIASSAITDLCTHLRVALTSTTTLYYNAITASQSSTVTGSSAGPGSTNVDTTAAMRLSITIQKGTASDTIVFRSRLFEKH